MRASDALLAAIIANPDEDTPRLMYADWLDENQPDTRPTPASGPSAQAEFIQVQCRLPVYVGMLGIEEWLPYLKIRDRAKHEIVTIIECGVGCSTAEPAPPG